MPHVATTPSAPFAAASSRLRIFAFAGALVAYGNAVSALPDDWSERYAWGLIGLGGVLACGAWRWATTRAELSPSEIGLGSRRAGRGVVVGLGSGAVLISPIVIYFLFPFGVPGGALDYERAQGTTAGSFLIWALVEEPLGTAIFEEFMFRGVLQGLALRAFSFLRAALLTALAFVLWHVVVNYRTVRETSAGESAQAAVIAQVASLAALFVGGMALSVLRRRTDSLAAPIAFHWVVVVAMQGALFAAI